MPGVGDVNVFGAPHAMRIWLDPQRLAAYSLMPGDVVSAIQRAEHRSRRRRGRRPAAAARADAQRDRHRPVALADARAVRATSSLKTDAERRDACGSSDVARVELGAENYNADRPRQRPSRRRHRHLRSHPAPTRWRRPTWSRRSVERAFAELPRRAIVYAYANDTTDFIKLSVEEVVKTLIEAIILVIIVMFVFLQSWRATLVPAIAIPVVLLGTFAVLYAPDFSINTLTLFGLVLAVGLLVDDAIVVVENVERLLEENPGHDARAKRRSSR